MFIYSKRLFIGMAFILHCLLVACTNSNTNSSSNLPCPSTSCSIPLNDNAGDVNNILVFSRTEGFRHASIDTGKNMLEKIANSNGWKIEFTEEAKLFNTEKLKQFMVVVWLNTTGDLLNDTQKYAFKNYIEAGGGYVGIHAAADTEYSWAWYGDLVGAYFKSHPKIQAATLNVENNTHPSTAHLGDEWNHSDEWYNYQTNPRSKVTVVLSLNETSYNPGDDAMGDHPIAWFHTVGSGRSFYTGLGHTNKTYKASKPFIKHIEGAIIWAGHLK